MVKSDLVKKGKGEIVCCWTQPGHKRKLLQTFAADAALRLEVEKEHADYLQRIRAFKKEEKEKVKEKVTKEKVKQKVRKSMLKRTGSK